MHIDKPVKKLSTTADRSVILMTGTPPQLEELLRYVCPEGFVRYGGKWFRGKCNNPKELRCSVCDFAGCEAL